MKLLSQEISLEKYISELNGYLSAVSHLNDAIGFRHGFYADIIYLDNRSIHDAVEEYTNITQIELKELNLRDELRIIKKYIFNNFMLGETLSDSKNISFIKEQLGWHIQDYVDIGTQTLKVEKRLTFTQTEEAGETTFIFIKVGNNLIVICFRVKREKVAI